MKKKRKKERKKRKKLAAYWKSKLEKGGKYMAASFLSALVSEPSSDRHESNSH